MLHLRLIVPAERSADVVDRLLADDRLTDVTVVPGAGRRPEGDLVSCDVTREAASDVLGWLRRTGLFDDGSVAIDPVEAIPSHNARLTEPAAVGAPEDAIIWDQVVDNAYEETRNSWSFYVFFAVATTLAAIAVITDSSVLVVGSMVVGPEFALIAAVALGVVLWRPGLIRRACTMLTLGFGSAILVTAVLALFAHLAGWVDAADIDGPRPLTAFIWRPDKWSVVVALLAGCIGVLSQTSGRGNALVGVFISVTTIPAAGDLGLGIGLGATDQMAGAATQLGVNLVGMTLAGVVTLLVQRVVWRRMSRRHERLHPVETTGQIEADDPPTADRTADR